MRYKKTNLDENISFDDTLESQDSAYESAFSRKIVVDKDNKPVTDEYVKKDEMWDEIRNYYLSLGDVYNWKTQKLNVKNTVFPPISLRLATMIDDISIRMGHRANFFGYTYLDEMRGDGKQKMFKAIRDGSFKGYSTGIVIDKIQEDDGVRINYYDKKNKIKYKYQEDTDVFEMDAEEREIITFKANAFGYFCRINSNSFLNRIKKERIADETKKRYQEETWERVLNTELWANVRRPKIIDQDENDIIAE